MNGATDTGVFAADLVQEQQWRNRWFNEWLQALTAAWCSPAPLYDGTRLLLGANLDDAGFARPASSLSTFAHPGEVEFGVGGADMGFGKAEFAAYDVGAFDERDAFVIGDAAAEALAAEAAIGRDDETFGRDVFECLADQC